AVGYAVLVTIGRTTVGLGIVGPHTCLGGARVLVVDNAVGVAIGWATVGLRVNGAHARDVAAGIVVVHDAVAVAIGGDRRRRGRFFDLGNVVEGDKAPKFG